MEYIREETYYDRIQKRLISFALAYSSEKRYAKKKVHEGGGHWRNIQSERGGWER